VFVDIEAKEDNIDAIELLEDDDAFASICELLRVVLEAVATLHSFANFQLAIHGGHLSNCDLAAHVKPLLLLGVFERDILKEETTHER
jgi:hypothetical protein